MRVLVVVPCKEVPQPLLDSLLNQTIPPETILLATGKSDHECVGKRVSFALNRTLETIRLDLYDYLVRLDSDVQVPPTFLESNLESKPKVMGERDSGSAIIISTEVFLNEFNGRFAEVCAEDTFLFSTLRFRGYNISDFVVSPVLLRKSRFSRSARDYVIRGRTLYSCGFDPIHVFGHIFLHKKIKEIISFFSYLLCYVTRPGKFPFAEYEFRRRVKRLSHMREYLKDRMGGGIGSSLEQN